MTARWLRRLLLAQLATLLVLGGLLAWFGFPRLALLLFVLGLPAGYLLLTGAHVLLQAAWCARQGAPACPAMVRWRIWVAETGLQMRAFIWLQPWREQTWPDWLGATSVKGKLGRSCAFSPLTTARMRTDGVARDTPNTGAVATQLPVVTARTPGVVLVHGYLCNRAFWNPLLARLQAEGTPFIAVNLEPMLRAIDGYAPGIDAAVARLATATGRPPVLLAHSMGGLAVRAWLASSSANAARVASVITVGSPHAGAWTARYANTIQAVQMRPGSAWLRNLLDLESGQRQPPMHCIAGDCDQLVYPIRTALLPGAQTLRLRGTGHLALAFHPATWDALQTALRHAREGHVGASTPCQTNPVGDANL
ncbi:MAG: alpha/beta fold hydrolase [Burkholderiales bacterium]|jgi:hypothetical protein|nr:alpha/beta fold hydrolase [Burkholderiales bacterium]